MNLQCKEKIGKISQVSSKPWDQKLRSDFYKRDLVQKMTGQISIPDRFGMKIRFH